MQDGSGSAIRYLRDPKQFTSFLQPSVFSFVKKKLAFHLPGSLPDMGVAHLPEWRAVEVLRFEVVSHPPRSSLCWPRLASRGRYHIVQTVSA